MHSIIYRVIRSPTSWHHAKGTWAIITGASYGVGKEIAFSLARRQINGSIPFFLLLSPLLYYWFSNPFE
jgi:hypothetical protein